MSSVVHHKIPIHIDVPARRVHALPVRIATTARGVESNAAPFTLAAVVLLTLVLAVVAAISGA